MSENENEKTEFEIFLDSAVCQDSPGKPFEVEEQEVTFEAMLNQVQSLSAERQPPSWFVLVAEEAQPPTLKQFQDMKATLVYCRGRVDSECYMWITYGVHIPVSRKIGNTRYLKLPDGTAVDVTTHRGVENLDFEQMCQTNGWMGDAFYQVD